MILTFQGDYNPVYVGFVVDKLAMAQVLFSQYFGFHLGQYLIYYGRYINLATDSVAEVQNATLDFNLLGKQEEKHENYYQNRCSPGQNLTRPPPNYRARARS
jgi:hypothetical protein